jgi:hypothetical protein
VQNTSILFVGYSISVKESLEGLVPNWPPDAVDAIPAGEAAVLEAREDVRKRVAEDPAVHLFDLARVVILDPQAETVFDTATIDKPAVSTAAGWLLDHYPDAWGLTPFHYTSGPPKVSFYGFDMRLFLKLLGLGAAQLGQALPAGLWYSNTDHRDMEGALLPSQCTAKKFTLMQAMKSIGMLDDPENQIDSTWEPKKDPMIDVRIASEIATRLGLLLVKKVEKIGGKTKTRSK